MRTLEIPQRTSSLPPPPYRLPDLYPVAMQEVDLGLHQGLHVSHGSPRTERPAPSEPQAEPQAEPQTTVKWPSWHWKLYMTLSKISFGISMASLSFDAFRTWACQPLPRNPDTGAHLPCHDAGWNTPVPYAMIFSSLAGFGVGYTFIHTLWSLALQAMEGYIPRQSSDTSDASS